MSNLFSCIINYNSRDRIVDIIRNNDILPIVENSVSFTLIELLNNYSTMNNTEINGNLNLLLNLLLESTNALETNYAIKVSDAYKNSINCMLKNKLNLELDLKELLELYRTVQKSNNWATTSRFPSNKTTFNFNNIKERSELQLTQPLNNINFISNKNIKLIDHTQNNKILNSNLTQSENNFDINVLNDNEAVFLAPNKEKDIYNLFILFLELFSLMATDESVQGYSIMVISKIIANLFSNLKAMPKEEKIVKMLILIKSGISETSQTTTLNALSKLENTFLISFPGNTIPFTGLKNKSLPFNEGIALICNSLNDDRIMVYGYMQQQNDDYNNGIITNKNKNIDTLKEMYDKYITSILNSISRLSTQMRKTGGILSKFTQNLIVLFKNSTLYDIIKNYFKSQIVSQHKIANNLSFIKTDESNLKIVVDQKNSLDLSVEFLGLFELSELKGSFTINYFYLSSILFDGFLFLKDTNFITRNNFCNIYGFSQATDQNIWKSILIFTFTYLSIMVYTFVNKDNIFKVNMYDEDFESINFLLSKESLEKISSRGIKIKSQGLNSGAQFIISHAIADSLTYYMYKNIDPTNLSDIFSSGFN